MLLSTRNFLLYLIVVGFLVVAVTTTAVTKRVSNEAAVVMGVESAVEPVYEVEPVVSEHLDREERLRTLRGKIAALGDMFTAESVEDTPLEPVTVPIEAEEVPERTEPLFCASQSASSGDWVPGPVTFSVVEGARLVTRAVTTASTTASGTPLLTTETKVLMQLPLRSVREAGDTCLPTDVVGVASDGSLIRNSEIALYSVFGSETLVGYALDGFPIYGTNAGIPLDACGGTNALGQYRYYLDKERPQILNCFAALPIEI